uniref:Ragulator complex protein LAMTOR1 n=1 Tax=Corethrella appendiculata TaxID=1370023 RepID=U5EWX5_9DIPT
MNYIRSIINYTASLGCCFCHEDSVSTGNEPNERTHLLVDPVSNSPAVRRSNSDDFINDYPNSLPKKDEQTALNKIIQDTATNIIDVAAMDSSHLQPQEYNDRVKLYSNRLAQQWNSINHPTTGPIGLLKDIPNPETILSSSPISNEDLIMMRSVVQMAHTALSEIKIEHTDELVVPFRIP